MKIAVLCQLWPTVLQDLQRRYDCVVAVNPEHARQVAAGRRCGDRGPAQPGRARSGDDRARSRACGWWCAPVRDWTISMARPLASAGFRTICVPLSAQSVAEHTCWPYPRVVPEHSLAAPRARAGPMGEASRLRTRTRRQDARPAGIRADRHLHSPHWRRLFRCRCWPTIGVLLNHTSNALPMTLDVNFVTLPDLFAGSDIVTIQIPLDDSHHHMVGKELTRPDENGCGACQCGARAARG